jgi:O-acetyl-ADP-ribose deacetylase (regulator of RNase III)
MFKETIKNLFEAKAEALVNTINRIGVMGKGIAWQFKQKFPADYFNAYKLACQNGELAIGNVQVYELKNARTNPHHIINFPTKRHWREQSRIADIERGLQSLVKAVELYGINSIAMPALGCGLGGLDYTEVKPLIEKAFASLTNVEVLLFVPK